MGAEVPPFQAVGMWGACQGAGAACSWIRMVWTVCPGGHPPTQGPAKQDSNLGDSRAPSPGHPVHHQAPLSLAGCPSELRGGVASPIPLLALELIWARSLPGWAPAAVLPGGGRLSMETAV